MKDQEIVSENYNQEDYMGAGFDIESLGLEEPDSHGREDNEDYQVEDYFIYIEGLPRNDLIILLKWEIQNRLAVSECMEELESRIQSLLQKSEQNK
jgi:hypothetical protein